MLLFISYAHASFSNLSTVVRQSEPHVSIPTLRKHAPAVLHYNRTVPKCTGEHAKIEKRLTIHILPGVFAYYNEKFVSSQLFGVLRKY